MKVLVTGGRGFVGHSLVESLVTTSLDSLVVLDNDSTGMQRPKLSGVTYIDDCVSQINLCDYRADVVVHLGEYSRVQQSYDMPLKALTNITSTLPFVLEYCRQHGSKLIYAGSSTKYGNADSPYSIAKALNTEMVQRYCAMFNMPYAITYFYNAYGNGECSTGVYSTVVAKFLKAYKDGASVDIYGTGKQQRNFTHIDDIVSGICSVMQNGSGDGYGIGSDESFSVIELADMIGLDYKLIPDVAGNRTQATLNTEKTKQLGWKPVNYLPEYILQCIKS